MDKLFELSATLTLDAAAFLHGLAQAEQAAQAAARRLQQALTLRMPSSSPGFATGLSYVPYNDFPARLHEGEAVLSKLEAQRYRSGASGSAAVDPDALAGSVAAALAGMTVQMDGQIVGQLVAPTVSRELLRQTQTRRYNV